MALEALDPTMNQWNVRQAVLSRRAAKVRRPPRCCRAGLTLLSQCARSHRIEDALRILFQAVDTREKRHAMGVLELHAWKLAVWDIVRTGAERQCVFSSSLSRRSLLNPGSQRT